MSEPWKPPREMRFPAGREKTAETTELMEWEAFLKRHTVECLGWLKRIQEELDAR